MLGAIAGDVIGSRWEFNNTDDYDFPLFDAANTFTDDSVLTIATADVLLNPHKTYSGAYQAYYDLYPNRGWGGMFGEMASRGSIEPYDSYGNGSAMRVSAVGCAFLKEEDVLKEAKRSAEVSHNHPEGVKGAQATAWGVWALKHGYTKDEVIATLEKDFGYEAYGDLIPRTFDETCQGTLPVCITHFRDSVSFEDAMRRCVSGGGDVDTIAAIVGAWAQFAYNIPRSIIVEVYRKLPDHLRDITTTFTQQHVDYNFVAPTDTMTDGEKLRDAFRSLFM